jgi:hypothetical protein
MDVLITFGRHAGQVRDIAPEAALAMLSDGRAKRPDAELEPPQLGDAIAEVAPPVAGAIDLQQERAASTRRRSRR